jgi:ABC-type lipoprotein release transport system permease subunit
VRQAIAPVVVGLGFGLLLIRWARGLAEAQLYEVNTRDPWTLATAAAAVLVAALVAAYLPARRATRINPVAVLRAE